MRILQVYEAGFILRLVSNPNAPRPNRSNVDGSGTKLMLSMAPEPLSLIFIEVTSSALKLSLSQALSPPVLEV